ncbi:DUF3081 family protein [Litorilituus sediminis]|uniref:DUF3081 domain-containing protein n=1 Tax=Litorilituus sediminis TaxID=718192 RepID=A0A4V0ZG28_9GAMM|nr:DUF3081 family protein [Litorilituus sediminis]QBG35850.1 DUF3081 domain-containing protein [Litorilituus sediminis]
MEKVLQEQRNFLQVFNIVSSQGEKIDDSYEYQGIKAWHDFGGYTCWLQYNDLIVTLLFHNRVKFDYEHEDTVTKFIGKVDKILAKSS